ncbi:hypothetical protein D9M71_330880 [compost metagenome]
MNKIGNVGTDVFRTTISQRNGHGNFFTNQLLEFYSGILRHQLYIVLEKLGDTLLTAKSQQFQLLIIRQGRIESDQPLMLGKNLRQSVRNHPLRPAEGWKSPHENAVIDRCQVVQ